MRHPLLTLAAVCALLAPMTLRAPEAQAATPAVSAAMPATARVIVKFKSDAPVLRRQALSADAETAAQTLADRAQALSQRTGLALKSGAAVSDRMQVVFAQGISSAQLAARLATESDVEYAVVDQRRRRFAVPNDPLYTAVAGNGPASGQWYLRPPSVATPSGINAEGAWDVTTGTSSVVVAVLDTGVRFDHPDLAGKLHAGYDFIADVPTANDGNGRDADASDPGDWVTQAEVDQAGGPFEDCDVEDSSWHGTQVGGIVGAATHNGIGMASVGRNVMVLPVRVLGKCGGYDSDIIAGMRWAAGLSVPGVPANPTPARVLNLSLGGEGACDGSNGYRDAVTAVTAAGAVVVASAGNSAGHAVSLPANCSGVIGVTGLRHAGTKVGFSDLGPEVTISAPGGNCVNIGANDPCLFPILTTSNAGTTTPVAGSAIYTDSFDISVGTSFSAPLVAGAAALVLATAPSLLPAEVRDVLRNTARPFPTTGGDNGDGTPVPQCTAPQVDSNGDPIDQLQCYCTTTTCGAGMLDVAAAVQAAATVAAPTVPLVAGSANPSVGTTVNLNGSAAQASTGRAVVTYQWSASNPSLVSFADPNAAVTTLTAVAPGTMTVTLTVTDNIGVQTARSAPMTISAAPTAVIAPSATNTTAGTPVTLNASGSLASGGRSIVSYQWAITAGSSIATLSSTSGSSVNLQPTGEGSVTVALTVTDSAGTSATTTTTIAVAAVPVTGGGGGGGALGLEWLALLMCAVWALRRAARAAR